MEARRESVGASRSMGALSKPNISTLLQENSPAIKLRFSVLDDSTPADDGEPASGGEPKVLQP
jgi:hypothetical protein